MRKLGGYTVEQRANHYINHVSKRQMQVTFAIQINSVKSRKNGSKHSLAHLIAARNICYKHYGIELPKDDGNTIKKHEWKDAGHGFEKCIHCDIQHDTHSGTYSDSDTHYVIVNKEPECIERPDE
jgi:hypothetical protein